MQAEKLAEESSGTMKIAMICFSQRGAETEERLKEGWKREAQQTWSQLEIRAAKKSRYLPDSMTDSLEVWTREQFAWADCLIFIGACGIAVRHIAPYIRSKKTDPAVLVIDETGAFVISLLSGHLGGANELAEQASRILGAIPVITTATDRNHCFAVDVFAKKNHCEILNMQAAKAVSAALLAGKTVGFYSEFPIEGTLPEGLVLCDEHGNRCEAQTEIETPQKKRSEETGEQETINQEERVGIAVTIRKDCRPFSQTAAIVPKNVVLGMGCRRGKEAESIKKAAKEAVMQSGIYPQAIAKVTSIDLKKEEAGLLALAKQWQIPFETYSSERLRKIKGSFSASAFVKSVADVDNVCERSAVCGSNGGKVILKKQGQDGVTTALAAGEWRMHFE